MTLKQILKSAADEAYAQELRIAALEEHNQMLRHKVSELETELDSWRVSARILGFSFVVACVLLVVQPLVAG